MAALTLRLYLERSGIEVADFAKDIGRNRQIVHYWVNNGATVELTEAGLRIKTEKIVHETQVKK